MTIELIEKVHMVADQLHSVRERIKTLTAEEAELKLQVLAMHMDSIEGYNCKLELSHVAESSNTDYKALCSFLKPAAALIARFKKTKAAYTIINVRPL